MTVGDTVTDRTAAPPNGGLDDLDNSVEIVLPWWQRPANIITLLVATALIAGMIGWLVHDATSETDAGDVDVGFLQDMRVHHEQAVLEMSMIYLDRPDTDPGLRTIAREIQFGQSIEIGRMIQLLRDFDAPEAADLDEPAMTWMGMSTTYEEMPGMASENEISELAASSGNQADALFVRLMTAHHRGGIEMAEYAADEAGNAEVSAFATAAAQSQQSDIAEMERLVE